MSHLAHEQGQPRLHANRLARETSPYLLQHQHNPVDWYPWGPEALEVARRENKPIFLSVGYSTCYWCHVMERQCFEVESVAEEMNRRFVNIKVDREERPDVDQLYMLAVQVLTHRGGWPMSVWLTPELKPFYGGTYFPPPQFLKVLAGLDDAWQNRRDEVAQSSEQLTGILQRLAHPASPQDPITIDDAFVDTLVGRSVGDYEPTFGGFGNAPKFPRETVLEMLLTYLAGAGDAEPKATAEIRRRVLHALDAMAHGGIRDQLGGGFHRYSTDEKWLVPHFEIMLYDNAMLAWCYAEAFRQTGDERYAQIARDVFDFILREMTSPEGSFYTAFDAEVDGQEGLNYLWTKGEVDALLGADAAHFNRVYGVDQSPNFADPHHGNGLPDKSILFLAQPGEGKQSALLDPGLRALRQKLYEARQKRKQPLLDTKILTSWNALMIRAFAHGSTVLKEPRYLQAGERAADFLLKNHRTPDGGLFRTSRGGQAKYDAFLDDYAFFAQALLALHDAGADIRFKREGVELAIQILKRFGDEDAGGFYFTAAGAADLIVRQKTATDSPLPSGNAVAAMVLLSLGQIDGVRTTLAAFAQPLLDQGEGMSSMVQAAVMYLRKTRTPFTVSAAESADEADRPMSPQQVAAGVVSARAEWMGPRELLVHLSILRGFHINAHEPGAGEVPLIPTRLTPEGAADVERVDYPPGEEQRFAFTDQPVRVYSGNVAIAVKFRTDQDLSSVPRLTLAYQACDDSACLPPVTRQLESAANAD